MDFFLTAGVCATTDFHSQNFYCFIVASETLSENIQHSTIFSSSMHAQVLYPHSCFESTADKLNFLNPLSTFFNHFGVLFFEYISSIYVNQQRFIEIFKLKQFFSIQQNCKSEPEKKVQNSRRKIFSWKKKKKYFLTIFLI